MRALRHPSTTGPSARGKRRWVRLAGVGALTSVLGLGTMTVVAAPALATTSRAVAVDWQRPWDTAGSQTTSTVTSSAATAKQSVGVVVIDTVLTDGEAAGTGIVLTANGEILTNYHVVEGSTSIKVTIAATDRTYVATVVGHDQTHDVALLQLKNASGLATATIDQDTVATGDKVTAVGNAGGTGTLTAAKGTVTALGASITTESEGTAAGESLSKLIETSADVVPGDSGGPLLDAEGEVLGIDTAASSGAEIDGYAIPISRALSIVDTILSGKETTTVSIGANAYLGVEVSDAAANTGGYDGGYGGGWGRSSFGDTFSQTADCAAVVGVVDGGPAADAGLVAGDTITAIAGHAVGSASDLTGALSQYDPSDQVTITWTDTAGTSHTGSATLGSSPLA